MKILTREDIAAADDLKLFTVDVPEWGGSLVMRPMSVKARRNCRNLSRVPNEDGTQVTVDDVKMQSVGVAMSCEQPKLSVIDFELFEQKASGVVDRLFTEVLVKSGFKGLQEDDARKKDQDKKKTKEDPLAPQLSAERGGISDSDFTEPQKNG